MEMKIKKGFIILKDFLNRKEKVELRKILFKGINMVEFNGNIKTLDYENLENYKEKAKELLITEIQYKKNGEELNLMRTSDIIDFIDNPEKVSDEEYLKLENIIDTIISGKKKF